MMPVTVIIDTGIQWPLLTLTMPGLFFAGETQLKTIDYRKLYDTDGPAVTGPGARPRFDSAMENTP
jgi:hypothetical protein